MGARARPGDRVGPPGGGHRTAGALTVRFLLQNARWLGGGFLLTFASAFGQTWFISLFAGDIKQAFALTDGGWGTLYTVATLASAALLFGRGSLADTVRLAVLGPAVAVLFALAGLGMAFGQSVLLLGLSVFLLRFCGQGMFSHIAMTAMGRWFEARRGRAVAIANLGHPAGEVVLPILAVVAIEAVGWRATWTVVAAVLLLFVTPFLAVLLSRERTARGAAGGGAAAGLGARHWTRREAVRHWLFPALLPIMLTPGFIGTVVFFHQVHIAETKGWSLAEMAAGYPVLATIGVAAALSTGWATDRLGPHRLIPVVLLPTGLGVFLIGPATDVSAWVLSLGLIGLTQGMVASLWGAFLPFVYGTGHLGSVRAMATTVMVVSTAIGPGITGILIDQGIDFPRQALVMGLWCLALSALGLLIARRLSGELAPVARS